MTTRSGCEISSRCLAALVPLALVALAGCRSDILKEQAVARPESGQAARVEVLEGTNCGAQASVITTPEHCAWPEGARRSLLLSAVVQVVAQVGPDGRAHGARLVNAPAGYDFDAAAVQCALESTYRPQSDSNGNPTEGETCPVSFRLARYATDVRPRDPLFARSCPAVQSYLPQSPISTTCDTAVGP
jgi:hypothetical protein